MEKASANGILTKPNSGPAIVSALIDSTVFASRTLTDKVRGMRGESRGFSAPDPEFNALAQAAVKPSANVKITLMPFIKIIR